MSNILVDETGSYDLEKVAHITPQKRVDSAGKHIATHAVLFTDSGTRHDTVSDYDKVCRLKFGGQQSQSQSVPDRQP